MPNHNPNQERAALPDVPKTPLPWQLQPGPKLRRQYLALRESGRGKASVLAAIARWLAFGHGSRGGANANSSAAPSRSVLVARAGCGMQHEFSQLAQIY